uniref:Leucine rich repeat containing 45 n=1 Tax=Pseudonaja textilis TaxID=8673 RepID=A0A670XXD5_PSETE
MDAFRQSYTRLCKENGAEPQESILPHLEEATGRNRLDLATQSLSVDSCGILGKLLQDDLQFTELILSDCMLSEEGGTFFVHKGNNLRTVGAEALGKLLRQNKTIQRLILEWNNLGVWEESFTIFCEGLGANHHLQMLDLRNNQINHQGAGELAMALKANSSLQELDLRWNNIGLLGGRALLNCLHSNRTVRQLELAGNNVPSDILKAVDQAMEHNQERQNILSKNRNMTKILSKEVMCLKEEKAKQCKLYTRNVPLCMDISLCSLCRVSASRVWRLQEALNERYSVMNSLKAKLQMTEAALALSEQKVCSLGELLSTAKEEQTKLLENQAKEFHQHKKNSSDREAKLLQELSTANENNFQLKNEVDELERRCKIQQEQLFQVKEELTHTTAEMKLRAVQAEERLENEKKRFKQILSDAESLRMKEVGQITQHMETSEHALQERIQRLEAIRIGLEEELSQVKAAAFIERGKIEEEVIRAKNQTRLEEQQRLEQMEEKLRLMMQSRDEAQNHCLQQKRAVAEAHAKEGQLSLQVEGLKRRLEDLQQELGSKEQEKVSEVNKVRVELQEQIGHLEAERTAQEGLREKIAALERQLKVLSSNHREALLDKESEISSLLEKLRVREAEISRIREEEAQRASFLQNAILTYVQGSPLGSLSPKK